MKVVGIDGCKLGWIAVIMDSFDNWSVEVFGSIEELIHKLHSQDLFLIDIPIGLREDEKNERLCDLQSRKSLGQPRGSSVFTVPSRTSIYCDTYEEANKMNKELVGRGIPKQTWGIVPKIKEVDTYIRNNIEIKERLKESHPEVGFWALSGRPMKYSKRKKEGYEERKKVLSGIYPKSDEIIEYTLDKYLRKEVQKDDMLDALCLALNGVIGAEIGFKTVPNIVEVDVEGLSMAITVANTRHISAAQ